jgi:hypothetical protein
MIALSSQCLAIANASENGTLRLVRREGRFGEFVAIADTHGTIEVADSMAEASARINSIRERIAA